MQNGSDITLPTGDLPVFIVVSIVRLNEGGRLPVGIFLLDRVADRLYIRFREEWAGIADEDAIDVVTGMSEMFQQRAADDGPTNLVMELLEQLSNYVQLGKPRTMPVRSDFESCLDHLYDEHVGSALG